MVKGEENGESSNKKVNKCRRIEENDSDTRWLFRCDFLCAYNAAYEQYQCHS